jgi:hypothetical protein
LDTPCLLQALLVASHVMTSHLAAVVFLTCVGAVLGHFKDRLN